MIKFRSYLLPGLLFLISFFTRLALISRGPYHGDTFATVMLAEEALAQQRLPLLWSQLVPLTTILSWLVIALFKALCLADPFIAYNFMSVMLSSFCVVVLHSLVLRIFDKTTALFASFLFSMSPIFLGSSVYGNSHIPGLFFLLCGMQVLFKSFESNKTHDFVLSGLLLGCAAAARFQDFAVMIIPLGCVFFQFARRHNSFKDMMQRFALIIISILGVFLLCYLPFAGSVDLMRSPGAVSHYWQQEFLVAFVGFFSWPILHSWLYLARNFGPYGLILSALGFLYVKKTYRQFLLFLLLWMVVPFFAFSSLDIVVPRFLIVSLAPFYITIGLLFTGLLRYHLIFKIIALMLFFTLLYFDFRYIFPILQIRHENALIVDYARWFAEVTPEDAVIISGDEKIFIEYFGGRKSIGRPAHHLHEIPFEVLDTFQQEIDNYLKNNIPVFITEIAIYTYNHNQQFSNFLTKKYRMKRVGARFIEDWHRGEIYSVIHRVGVYELFPLK